MEILAPDHIVLTQLDISHLRQRSVIVLNSKETAASSLLIGCLAVLKTTCLLLLFY